MHTTIAMRRFEHSSVAPHRKKSKAALALPHISTSVKSAKIQRKAVRSTRPVGIGESKNGKSQIIGYGCELGPAGANSGTEVPDFVTQLPYNHQYKIHYSSMLGSATHQQRIYQEVNGTDRQ